jgi:hypothetical protein
MFEVFDALVFFFYLNSFPACWLCCLRIKFAVEQKGSISLFHRAFQFTMSNGLTNALVRNKTLIQMSHIKTLKITPTCFDHQLIIIRELI